MTAITWQQFFATVGPHVVKRVEEGVFAVVGLGGQADLPSIRLHCESEMCGGETIFDTSNQIVSNAGVIVVKYQCRHCRTQQYIYAVVATETEEASQGPMAMRVMKVGQIPRSGMRLEARVLRMIDDQNLVALMKKGLVAEAEGLGIGAFTYYRRVVEQATTQLLGAIRKAMVTLGVDTEHILVVENAMKNTQYKTAMKSVAGVLPDGLLIAGQNPLTLLYAALSVGVHELDDEACLELAYDVRVLLGQICQRVAEVLRDDADVRATLSRLARVSNPKQR